MTLRNDFLPTRRTNDSSAKSEILFPPGNVMTTAYSFSNIPRVASQGIKTWAFRFMPYVPWFPSIFNQKK